MPTRVVVIDADATHRRALAARLESSTPRLRVVAALAPTPAAASAVRALQPHVVLLAPAHDADPTLAVGATLTELYRVLLLPSGREHRDRLVRNAERLGGFHIVEALLPLSDPMEGARLQTLTMLLHALRGTARPRQPTRARPSPTSAVRVVLIAASTGGPEALRQVLAALPREGLPPVVVVQHLAQGFMEGLATWLTERTAREVRVAVEGERLEGGRVYLAPHDRHVRLGLGMTLTLGSDSPVNFARPSADVLFKSAEPIAPSACVVVLSGMGRDGADGAARLQRAGARVSVQTPATCVADGMPRAVIAQGAANAVLGLDAIAYWIAAECGVVAV